MKKRMKDYPAVYRDCWALHEALRRMGFESEDIFVVCSGNAAEPTTGEWFFVVLKTQGKEFTITVRPIETLTYDEALAGWTAFVTLVNARTFSLTEMQRVYKTRFLDRFPGPSMLVSALLAKGFTLPRQQAEAN